MSRGGTNFIFIYTWHDVSGAALSYTVATRHMVATSMSVNKIKHSAPQSHQLHVASAHWTGQHRYRTSPSSQILLDHTVSRVLM